MRVKKLENILNSGSFHSEISPETALALKAKLQRTSFRRARRGATAEPILDFDEINKEAIKLVGAGVKYPQKLPKGVVISVRKKPRTSAIR